MSGPKYLNTAIHYLYVIAETPFKQDAVAPWFTPFGEKKYPIITIRHNFGEKENIINYKNVIIDDLKNNGFHITDKIQREISIYDTNPDEDKGWISKL